MFKGRFQDLAESFSCIESTHLGQIISEDDAFDTVTQMLAKVIKERGIVYVIGNGGSAGIASHFSIDLIKTLKIPSQTLFDSNLMTCLANDWGYKNVFSYPLSHLLKPHDLLVAISSSGKSSNILEAVKITRSLYVPVITLSGFSSENPLRTLGDLNFWVDRPDYGLVEMTHFILLHTIIDLWSKDKVCPC